MRPQSTRSRNFLVLVFLFAAASGLRAQINFPDFSTADDLVLVGTASHRPPEIELNALVPKTAGGVWYTRKQPVASGFTATFEFQILDTSGQMDARGLTGGDGLAFVIQNAEPSPIGGHGGQIGYDPIRNSVAVEFDTYANNEPGFEDPNANHVSVHTTGRGTNSASHAYSRGWNSTFVPNLSDGRRHKVLIAYHNGMLTVYIDGCNGYVLSTRIDLATELALDSGRAWIGLTAGTGSAWERHVLTSWQFNGRPLQQFERVGLCQGQAAVLTVPGTFSNYRWSTGARTPTITVYRAGRCSVTVIDSTGCIPVEMTWTFDVTVAPAPKPKIAAVSPMVLCAGGTITLDAGDYPLYRWSTGAVTRTITVRQPGKYWVEVTTALGCTGRSDTLDVVQRPIQAPRVTITGPTAFCDGDSVTLDAGPGFAAYRWTTGATTRSLVVRSAGTYSVTVVDSNGCNATSAAVLVLVWPKPYPVIEMRGPRVLCGGDSVTLRPLGNYQTLRWSTGDTTQELRVGQSGTYWIEVTNANGCRGISPPVRIDAFPAPLPKILADTIRRPCRPDSVVLRTASPYRIYRWSNGDSTATTSLISSGAISVDVIDSNGCGGRSDTIAVTLRDMRQIVATISGARNLCEGEEAVLSGPEGLIRYDWSTGETTRSIVVRTGGRYRLSGIDPAGCESADSIEIRVDPRPELSLSPDTTICAGTNTQLIASGALQFLWIPVEGLTCAECATPVASPSTSTLYTVIGSGEGGCLDTAQVMVTVLPAPQGEVRIEGTRAYPGSEVELPVSLHGPLEEARASSFVFEAVYDARMMRLRGVVLSESLLSGWDIATEADSVGYFRARLSSRTGEILRPQSPLLSLRFTTFLGTSTHGLVRPEVTIPASPCAAITSIPAEVVLDSVCGVGLRMIEALGGVYALRAAGGVVTDDLLILEIELPVESPATVELFSAAGNRLSVIHRGMLPSGRSTLRWEATDLPSGVYLCRAVSGNWSASMRMFVVR